MPEMKVRSLNIGLPKKEVQHEENSEVRLTMKLVPEQ